MTLVLVGARDALAVHARIVQTVIDGLADENVVVWVALTGREWTRPEQNALD